MEGGGGAIRRHASGWVVVQVRVAGSRYSYSRMDQNVSFFDVVGVVVSVSLEMVGVASRHRQLGGK